MKKWIAAAAALAVCVLMIVRCASNNMKRPDTNLEFWICDNVENFDFSDHEPRFGLMGGREYYGKGYTPATDENGQQIDPEHCVIYTVTAYPDYSSHKSHITRIHITDPAIQIYGLTLNSSDHDIHSTMGKNGFKLQGYSTYQKGKVSICFTKEWITISVEVSNFWRIQF